LVGFQDLGAKDDFTTRELEVLLIKKGTVFMYVVRSLFLFICSCLESLFNCHLQVLLPRKKTWMMKIKNTMKVNVELLDPQRLLILILNKINHPATS
jgi:hypothetical protein